ncbi:MAG: hypothetical protein LPK26_01200 [Bacillaceae bacterium]|nr:hypothetical protein [Bacillaceae bacterium]
MALQKHHKQMAIFLFWVAIILYFLGLIALFYNLGRGTQGVTTERILIYFLTFGLGTASLLIAYWRMKQIKEVQSNQPKTNEIELTDDLFTARRLMFVSSVSLREPYTYYSLEGQVVGKFKEEITSAQQILRIITRMILPFELFPRVLHLKTAKQTLTIEKRGGFFRPYKVYDQNQQLLSQIELGKKIIARYTLNIFDAAGEYIGNVTNVGSQSAYTVMMKDGKEVMFIRMGGIPKEAMQLFGTVEGDIVDIKREHVSDDEFLQIVSIPLLIKYTTAR